MLELLPAMLIFVVMPILYFAWKEYNKPDKRIDTKAVPLSQSDKSSIEESAKKLVDLVNESFVIAKESKDYLTRVSKTSVARDALAKLKELSLIHPGLSLVSFDEAMCKLKEIELETMKIKVYTRVSAPLQVNSCSNNDREIFEDSAKRVMQVINESIDIARSTKNPETKKSRIGVAKQKMKDLENLMAQFPTFSIDNLPYIQHTINSLEGDLPESRSIATITAYDVDPSLTKLYEAAETKPEGVFWADHIKTLKDKPKERLKYALKMKPLPAAYREAAIAYRALIKQNKKENNDHTKLLNDLYVLLAQQSFLYEVPYIEEIRMPGYNVASSIPKKTINGLQMPYSEIGYNHISAQKTDIKWFVDAWGEPEIHQKVQEYHATVWRDALDRYIQKHRL